MKSWNFEFQNDYKNYSSSSFEEITQDKFQYLHSNVSLQISDISICVLKQPNQMGLSE